jgi:hypothetical protein
MLAESSSETGLPRGDEGRGHFALGPQLKRGTYSTFNSYLKLAGFAIDRFHKESFIIAFSVSITQ